MTKVEYNQFFDEAFKTCKASKQAMEASKRICLAYGIRGICDPAYIANVIQSEINKSC